MWKFWIFKESFYYAQNVANGLFWGSKSTLLNCSLKLFIKFFYNGTWWQGLKIVFKWLFWNFEENSCYTQNESILGPKSLLLNYYLNLLIRLLWSYTWWQAWIFLKFYAVAGIQKKVKWFFSGQLSLYPPKNLFLNIFGYKIDMFHISCFTTLFFLVVLM